MEKALGYPSQAHTTKTQSKTALYHYDQKLPVTYYFFRFFPANSNVTL